MVIFVCVICCKIVAIGSSFSVDLFAYNLFKKNVIVLLLILSPYACKWMLCFVVKLNKTGPETY